MHPNSSIKEKKKKRGRTFNANELAVLGPRLGAVVAKTDDLHEKRAGLLSVLLVLLLHEARRQARAGHGGWRRSAAAGVRAAAEAAEEVGQEGGERVR